MFGIDRIVNLRIGTKLGVTSAVGVVLVLAIIATLMVGNNSVRTANDMANRQQTIVAHAVAAKASVRGMQIGVRDVRLAATPENLKAAMDYLGPRHKSAVEYAEQGMSLVTTPENRERSQRLKTIADQYAAGAKEIEAVSRACRRAT
jgi:Flp pilus assembly secretin CpaC